MDVHNAEGFLRENLRQNLPAPPGKATQAEAPAKVMDFDDMLPYVGEFGLYQKLLFLMMIPFAFFVSFVYFAQIFITLVPESHFCLVPELSILPFDEQVRLSVPRDANGGYDQCSVYDVDWSEVLASGVLEPNSSWPTKTCDSGWYYNKTEIPYSTVATELNWVCDYKALPTIAQAVFFCGAIVGGLIFGWMADRYGRIPALVGTNLTGLAAGVLTAFSSSFWQFCLCRFFVGFAFDNCFTMMYILVLEYVGPKWRTFVANMSIAIFFTLASCSLPWIALWVADWRWLSVVTAAPLALAVVTPWMVPESARWLVSKGEVDKAVKILKKFERINKKQVPDSIYNEFQKSCQAAQKEEEAGKNYSVLDLFRSPRLRKITILLIVIWMAISLVFDGHVRNVGSLGLDVFLTFTLASATEMPADTFLTLVLDRWGRRWLACGSMVISGVFSLLATAVPTGVPSASLAIMGRFSVNISYNIGLQYAAELLPTVVRAQGVALIHIMGYVASILAPFVVYLTNINTQLPLLVLGVLGILGGVLALFLPETMDQELPQTITDGENFGIDQSFFDIPCDTRNKKEPQAFKRSTDARISRSSIRASIRGEHYRSTLINRSIRRPPTVPAIQET